MPLRRLDHKWLATLAGVIAAALSGCTNGGPTIEGRLSQTLSAETNRELDIDTEAALLSAALEAGLILTAETRQMLLSADLGFASAYYEGGDSLAGTGRIDPRLAVRAQLRRKTVTYRAVGNVALSSSDTSQVDDSGITDVNATQITGVLSSGIDIEINPQNHLSLDFDARVVDFDKDVEDLNPTQTLGTQATLRRELNETTDLRLAAGLRHFTADNDTDTRSQTLDLSGAIEHQRTPRHRARLSLGVSAVRTVENNLGTSFDIGFTGGFGADYRLSTLRLGFDATQAIEPSTVGALQAFTRVTAQAGYDINSNESLGATLSYTQRTPFSGDGETVQSVSIGPSYNLSLNAATKLTFGYLFRLQNDDDGTGTGHRIFLTIERAF